MPEYGCRLLTLTHPGSATKLHMGSITIFPAEVTRSQMRDTYVAIIIIKQRKRAGIMIIIIITGEQLKRDRCQLENN